MQYENKNKEYGEYIFSKAKDFPVTKAMVWKAR